MSYRDFYCTYNTLRIYILLEHQIVTFVHAKLVVHFLSRKVRLIHIEADLRYMVCLCLFF